MLTGTIQIDISLHAYNNNYPTVPALYIGCHQPNKCSIQQRGKVIERQRSRKKNAPKMYSKFNSWRMSKWKHMLTSKYKRP